MFRSEDCAGRRVTSLYSIPSPYLIALEARRGAVCAVGLLGWVTSETQQK